jgi:hypothetical protein
METSGNKEALYGTVQQTIGAERNGRCHGSVLAILGLSMLLLVCMAALTDMNSSRTVLWNDPLAMHLRERSVTEKDVRQQPGTERTSDVHKVWSDPMVVDKERMLSQTHDAVQRGPAIADSNLEHFLKQSGVHHSAEVRHQASCVYCSNSACLDLFLAAGLFLSYVSCTLRCRPAPKPQKSARLKSQL